MASCHSEIYNEIYLQKQWVHRWNKLLGKKNSLTCIGNIFKAESYFIRFNFGSTSIFLKLSEISRKNLWKFPWTNFRALEISLDYYLKYYRISPELNPEGIPYRNAWRHCIWNFWKNYSNHKAASGLEILE